MPDPDKNDTKKHLVVLTGAGISSESGLKTFRDSDGLWEGYDVYEVATPGGWKKNPQLVLDFYNARRKDVKAAQPNAAHYGLVELEKEFKVTVITQNIDDLHERAGSTNVVHLHGEIFKMKSERNESLISSIYDDIHIGDLAEDGAQFRPHVVWFEEPVPMIETAIQIAGEADVFAVIGTSLAVYPAAGILHYVSGYIPKYIIDKKIPLTGLYNLTVIEKPATEGIEKLKQSLKTHL